jgi:hypothetical protein
MVNRGVELSADADIIQGKDFRVNLGLNLTYLNNEITKMPDIYNVGGEKDEYNAGLQSGQYNYRKGHSMYSFYTYTYKGIDDMTGKALYTFNDHDYYIPGFTKGNVENLEAIPAEEYVIIDGVPYVYKPATYGKREWHGSALPKLYGSFNPTIDFKNFTLSGIFSFQLGGKCIDWTYQSLTSMGGSPSAIHADMQNAWIKDLNGTVVTYNDDQIKDMTVTNDDGSYINFPASRLDPNGTPAVYSADNSYNSAASSRYITSSNYFIVKNIGLSYRLPRTLLNKIGFTNIALSATIENLYTKSARKGMNPQQSFSGYVGDIMVTPRVYSFGVKIGF